MSCAETSWRKWANEFDSPEDKWMLREYGTYEYIAEELRLVGWLTVKMSEPYISHM